MSLKLGILMDPIEAISFKKDSSLAMLMAAQTKGWDLFYMEQGDLYISDGKAFSSLKSIQVSDNKEDYYKLGESRETELAELDILLMRKDPPFDMNFIYTTYILELAESQGLKVINRPSSLRDCNEKVFTSHFPQCSVPTLVSQKYEQLEAFLDTQGVAIIKPLDGMGGESIFKLEKSDGNTRVILETLTGKQTRPAMIQKYIPEIKQGDKRVLMIGGEPVPFVLARIPQGTDNRGNLAAGGKGEVREISERERWICQQVAPELKTKGLDFVGIDIIGDYLTEINVTSPTCIREIDEGAGTDIAMDLMNYLEAEYF